MITLITGGIKSGKSQFALEYTKKMRKKDFLYFIATATALDDEMRERISKHQQERNKSVWRTIEEPVNLVKAILDIPDKSTLLIDCITLWLNNRLFEKKDEYPSYSEVEKEIKKLISLINKKNINATFVSNEVGWGIIPENKLSRLYNDYLGKLNQIVASLSSQVYLMVSGIDMKIK